MLLAQPRRVFLLHHHPPGHPPRLLPLSPPAHSNHRRVYRSLERPPPALRLDQERRRAALNTATGEVTDACYPRHRHQEFLKFLKNVAAAYPAQELHVVCDTYSPHKHAEVNTCLLKNPRIPLHFPPSPTPRPTHLECFFSIITRQAIRRGSFTSVKQLVATIGT